MKNKLIVSLFGLGLFAYSCGSTPEVDEKLVEETLQLQLEVDELNKEIEALNEAGSELNNATSSLDAILEEVN